ncbi:MAG: hypothetical protein AB7E76_11990 [Deferribacterales bacterium]
MKKIYILPMLILILAACTQFDMKFQPTQDLKANYPHSVKDQNLAIYYKTVKGSDEKTVVQMAVQNIGNIYMSNLTINYDDCCQALHQGPGSYLYKNLGNLKNRAHKTMSISIPSSDVKIVTLDYTFIPVTEDAFLKQNNEYTPSVSEVIKSRIILYTGK